MLNQQLADPRPDWADDTRGQCRICRSWRKLTKAGELVRHKRQEPGRWHMVPCEGSGNPPAVEQSAPDTRPSATTGGDL